jgi:superoxide dismutase
METSPKIKSLAYKANAINESCSQKILTNRWDKCLDDYENYTKEYIKQYKKSLKGNSISLSKYPYMKAKSEALCERLNNAQDKALLSKKQLKRISKIQMKMVNVCGTLK